MTLSLNGHSNKFKKICQWSKKYARESDLYAGPQYCVSFEAVLTYLTNRKLSQIERHFKPISSLCNVCDIDFTDVSETKTLGKSIVQLMKDVAVKGDEYMVNALTANKENFNMLEPYTDIISRFGIFAKYLSSHQISDRTFPHPIVRVEPENY